MAMDKELLQKVLSTKPLDASIPRIQQVGLGVGGVWLLGWLLLGYWAE